MLPEEKHEFEGAKLKILDNQLISTSYIGSLDRKDLYESRRMLALYLTDIRNTGSVIEYSRHGGATVMETGSVPFLLRQGTCRFAIKTKHQELPQIWALKYDGSRSLEVKPEKTPGGFAFTVRAVSAKDTYIAYEIIWK